MDKLSKIIQAVGISLAAFVLAGFTAYCAVTANSAGHVTTPSVSRSVDLTYLECSTIRTC